MNTSVVRPASRTVGENFVFLVLLEYICENFVFLVHTTGARVGGGVVPRRGVPLSVCVSVCASSSLTIGCTMLVDYQSASLPMIAAT